MLEQWHYLFYRRKIFATKTKCRAISRFCKQIALLFLLQGKLSSFIHHCCIWHTNIFWSEQVSTAPKLCIKQKAPWNATPVHNMILNESTVWLKTRFTPVSFINEIFSTKMFTGMSGAVAQQFKLLSITRESSSHWQASRSFHTTKNPASLCHSLSQHAFAHTLFGEAGRGCLALVSGTCGINVCGLSRPIVVSGRRRYQSLLESNEKSVRQQRQAATKPSESSPAVTSPNAKRYKVLSQNAGLSLFV